MQALAFEEAPILIPAVEQIAFVNCNRIFQQLRTGFIELSAGGILRDRIRMFEYVDVEPELTLQVQMYPVMFNHEQRDRGGLFRLKRRLHLPQRLPKIFFRFFGGGFCP